MSLAKYVNDFLSEQQEARKGRVGSGKYIPSNFGCCFRKQWFKKSRTPESNPSDERAMRVFKCGNLFEQFIVDCLPPEHFQFQVMVSDDLCVGFADVVGEETVYDVKSAHSKSFWYMEKSKEPIALQKKNNVMQVVYYAMKLNKENGALTYVSKDDLTIAEYIFPVSKYGKWVEEELSVLKAITDKPKAEPRTVWDCSYCSWFDTCGEGKRKEVKKKEAKDGVK